LSRTPWSERVLDIRLKAKEAGKAARAKAGTDRVPNTKPSHPLADYAGEYEHPAYGVVTISQKAPPDQSGDLVFDFHTIRLPLHHFHYDRFETPDDEQEGLWSLNFQTNPQGDVDKILISLDEAEVTFTRRVAADLTSPATLGAYTGTYLTPTGVDIQVVLKEDGSFGVQYPGGTFQALQAWKPRMFRVKEFSDVVIEFEVKDGKVTAMIQRDPSGERRLARK
jgi:hypothetical protein